MSSERVLSVGVGVGAVVSAIAGAIISLLLTDPVTVIATVARGEISPLVLRVAGVIYDAIVGVLSRL